MFLALLYVLGLATAVSIQSNLSNLTPNFVPTRTDLGIKLLTRISKYFPTDVLHT